MEVLPEVLRNYGRAVQHGNRNIYQSLPRMLTIWFQYGDYCCANAKPADNRVRSISPPASPSDVASVRLNTFDLFG